MKKPIVRGGWCEARTINGQRRAIRIEAVSSVLELREGCRGCEVLVDGERVTLFHDYAELLEMVRRHDVPRWPKLRQVHPGSLSVEEVNEEEDT